MNILYYGLTADPPHLGHTACLNSGINTLRPDITFVQVTAKSPTKEDPAEDLHHRKEMAKLAFQKIRTFVFSDFETEIGSTFTIDVLRRLDQQFPGDVIHILIGYDQLVSLSDWHYPLEVMSLAKLIVIDRMASESKCPQTIKDGYLTHLGLLTIVDSNRQIEIISSTAIRKNLIRGAQYAPSGECMCPEVVEYIQNHHLYHGEN